MKAIDTGHWEQQVGNLTQILELRKGLLEEISMILTTEVICVGQVEGEEMCRNIGARITERCMEMLRKSVLLESKV